MISIGEFLNNSFFNRNKRFNPQFESAGYYSAKLPDNHNWLEARMWCSNTFGIEHYHAIIDTYWFESEKDRNWFLLRWG